VAKLTLSVNDQVVSSAKRYARQHGLSISGMVETYLASVANDAPAGTGDTPILRSLRGSLKKADLNDYKKHLATKYR